MVPVAPSEFKELIVQPEDTLDVIIKKVFIRLPVLLWRLARYMIAPDGSDYGSEFLADICAIQCPNTTTSGTEETSTA